MSHPDVHFLATNDQVSTYLISNLQEGDVLLILSAGDAYQISERVVDSLSKNGNAEHG
jgi:UDP-N-acetylmuramate-alanine ligase